MHIPFCKSKCYYCDFVSFPDKQRYIEEYANALVEEIKSRDLMEYKVDSIYIGGGTPSILDSKYIENILNEIRLYTVNKPEVTIEINPGTVSKEKLKEYKDIRIHRISIGLQSTDNNLLKQIRKNTYI